MNPENVVPLSRHPSPLFEQGRVLLQEPIAVKGESSWGDTARVALQIAIAILFFPFSILVYLVYRGLAQFAAYKSLGAEREVRTINLDQRGQLRALGGEEIRFGFEGKACLEGMFFKTDSSSFNGKTILICSGSHLSYERYTLPMVEAFLSMEHQVMVFNYEGFGESEGERSEEGIYRSVEAAYQYLSQVKGIKDQDIVAWGYSLGSGAVSELALRRSVDIVLDRGFSSMSEVAHECAPFGLKTIAKLVFLAVCRFDNLSKLSRLSSRILIAQGTEDHMMTKLHGRRLQGAVSHNQNAFYTEVETGHYHSDPIWFAPEEEDYRVLEKFLKGTS